MNPPTYPTDLTNTAEQTLQSAFEAVDTHTMPRRQYTDDESAIDGRVYYDYNNNSYGKTDETISVFNDVDVSIYGNDAVITFHFNGTKGYWFDNQEFATEAYNAMDGDIAPPTEMPSVGVQIRGDDVYVQNKLTDATTSTN